MVREKGVMRKLDIAALARAISNLEDGRAIPSTLLKSVTQKKSGGQLIGVTGSQGAGKSTLIAALVKVIRSKHKKAAVIAVDPTSPKTGGAFLGDRVRMQSLAEDPGVFIRSMASRGATGGVAKATKAAALLCAKAGFDFVFIETVGAGQLDVEVTKFSDVTLLVLTPEAGDEMQFMKAGLRELADIFVVNKADRPGASQMKDFLKANQKESAVFKTVAETGSGVSELFEAVKNYGTKK